MARISTYSIDPNITADDKWIGTDFNTQYTKNFTPQYLADFFNVSNSIGVSGQVSFKYYSTFPSGRPEESITTPAVNPNFSAVTSFKIHKNSGGGNYCIDFVNYLSGDEILISDTSNADIFGHFKLNSVTQDLNETNFYNLNVTYVGGHGNLQHLKVYSIALYSAAITIPPITWGSITGVLSNQTDLTNYLSSTYFPIPTGTTLQYIRGNGSLATFPTIPTITPAALTKTDDTNITLTLGGSPSTALLQGVSLTLGWTGTLADSRIASASTWNAKQNALSGTGVIKSTAGTISYINGTTSQYIRGDGSLTTFPTIPTVGTWGALNYPTWTTGAPFVKMTAAGTFTLDTNTYLTSAVTSVTATSPITSSGGNTPVISTSIPSKRLVGRYSSEQGVMESIRIGTGLTLDSDGTLNNTGTYTSPLTTKGDLYTRDATADTRLPIGTNGQVLTVKDGAGTTNLAWANLPIRVSEVTAISPITSTEGVNPQISTSMSTNKLIGRSTAGTGVMEEITIGTGLTLSGGTLNGSATGVTSVGLTMPSAFNVASSPITSSGTLAVTGAGLVSQYVRGDGTLANFPTSTGGGSSVNYYLNGSVSQGTFGGTTYYQMSKTPILGAGTNFTRTNGAGNGYIASFITDAGDPSFLNIPGGNWNLEFYFQSSASGGSPEFYGEIYKVSATNVFTLVASGSANPEGITNGTTVDQYFTSISVPQTSLLVTDRLAVRIYVITSGRTITLHTENGNLCEVLTTFTTGLTALNGLTQQVQYFTVGTGATNFNISSSVDTHTFNLLFNIRRNANNSSNNNINYNGYAVTGSAESSAVWTITRLTIAASGSITTATATNVAWTNRQSATYI